MKRSNQVQHFKVHNFKTGVQNRGHDFSPYRRNLYELNNTESRSKTFRASACLSASISRGFGTTDGGPGTVISQMINPQAEVTNKSMSSHTSVESTKGLDYFATNPSIVLALDLFFWDANREATGAEFEANTRKLISAYQDKKIPMVVGLVPVNVKFPDEVSRASRKPSTKRINKLLSELCTLEKNCLLYDPKICLDKMESLITSPDGRPYFGDSMHTTNLGNKFCAEIFVESRIYRQLRPAL